MQWRFCSGVFAKKGIKMNYRHQAREYLKRSKEELATADKDHLKYAALELRMAMESLTYDRALAYKDEFPPDEYETWQPLKLMQVLIDIDPTADMGGSLAVGLEENPGVPASKMTSMGSEIVLNMSTLKEHYSALGSYLHVQSLKQSLSGKPINFEKIRSRCEEIVSFIEKVLSSSVFNITLGNFSTVACGNCGERMRKRLPHGQRETQVQCYSCHASYTLVDKGDNQVEWHPHQEEIECRNTSCKHKIVVLPIEKEIGKYWICPECKGRNIFAFGIKYEPEGSWKVSS